MPLFVEARATLYTARSQRPAPARDDKAVAAWNGDRIRKIVRRGRASAWERAQLPDGVTVERDGAEVGAFVRSVQYAVLDGPLILAKDREHGLTYDDGKVFPATGELWG